MTFFGHIDDGYSRKAYIAPRRGLHDAVRFEYRPLVVKQKARHLQEMRTLGLEDQQVKAAEVLNKQIVSWSIPLQRKESIIINLTPTLFDRMWEIVNGNDGGDMDPDEQSATPTNEAADAKNSLAGCSSS